MAQLIKDKEAVPAGGIFRYVQPESGLEIRESSWRNLVNSVRLHRQANGYAIPVDYEREVEEGQPSMFAKRAKSNNELQKMVSGTGVWTEEEEAALAEWLDKHGLDFDRIKAEYGALLVNRTIKAIEEHCRQSKNNQVKEKHREVKAAKKQYVNVTHWTEEEGAALAEGVDKYGRDYDRIKDEYGALLGKRTAAALRTHCIIN